MTDDDDPLIKAKSNQKEKKNPDRNFHLHTGFSCSVRKRERELTRETPDMTNASPTVANGLLRGHQYGCRDALAWAGWAPLGGVLGVG